MSQFHMHLLKGVTHGVESRVAISNSHVLSLSEQHFLHESYSSSFICVLSTGFQPYNQITKLLYKNYHLKVERCMKQCECPG